MTFSLLRKSLVLALTATALGTSAHVILPAGGAAAGSTYRANFVVGHACSGSQTTVALSVQLPAGFSLVDADSRPGWSLIRTAEHVTWTAASPADGLPSATPATFTVVGKLTATPGTLWFPTLQRCDAGSSNWAVVPDAGDPKPKFPAPHLDVLPPGAAAVDVRDAWAQPTLPGQTVSTVYMRLAAPAGARLVGVSSPAGSAAVHEMSMDGNVMRMREMTDGLDLPAGQPVTMTASTRHLMVTGLKQPLPLGGVLPVTLHFIDRDGRKGDVALQVPVAKAPAALDGVPEHHHGQ